MAAPRKPRYPHKEYLTKAPSEVHNGFAEFIAKTTGAEVPAETVGLVQRLYPLYLKSPAVVKAREEAAAAREAEKAAKEQAKRERAQARLDKIEAQRQRLLAELGLGDNAEVVEAADRFVQPGIEFAEADDDAEVEDEDEADEEPEAEVSVEAGEVEDDEDDDLWDDEADDEDEEDF